MAKVAIVGSGVSGLTAAYLLKDIHEVTIFESDDRFGGHAHTHEITEADSSIQNVDSGFIVHNERTYPNLLRIFKELGIKTQDTEMSMSINCKGCGLQYAGGRGAKGILAQPHRLLNPKFVKMLIEVPRFYKAAENLLQNKNATQITWGEFLKQNKFSEYFIKHYAVPVVSCVWSSGDGDSLQYPARHLFEFLRNHGMLELGNSPTWKTVVGGSKKYVDAITALFPNAKKAEPVISIRRFDDQVEIVTKKGEYRFDYVVVATHANTALKILVDASQSEAENLAAMPYSKNQTWLHTDSSVLPKLSSARASWNYMMDSCKSNSSKVLVSYWMNLLMNLKSNQNYVVTLNGQSQIDERKVIAKMEYEHPVFTISSLQAAKFLKSAGGPRLAFAGAHLGWGFHEDGARSGVEAARKFGSNW
ncbi:MAG: NAD(P)/FAD-dependent oxidoreductase [Candidatus Nanopelagicaceae bacterium]